MNVRNGMYLIVGSMVFALLGMPLQADEDRNEAGAATAETKAADPVGIRLAPPAGAADEKEYLDAIRKRVDEAAEKAGTETDPVAQAKRFLAAANLTLSDEMEPACTRRVLHLGQTNVESNERVARSLDRADAFIEQAKLLLESGAKDKEDKSASELRSHQRALDAFAKSLRCCLSAGSGSQPAANPREAASLLSPLLEDKNPKLVASATYWQALLRSQDQPPDRVLTMLDLPLSDPPADSLPYSLYARMLRCQLVASRGGHATAYGLLLQMEEASIRWLKNDKDADDAMRAISLVELFVLQQWHDRLDSTTEAAEREWCKKRIETITSERLTGDVAVYRLSPAIPMLVPIE